MGSCVVGLNMVVVIHTNWMTRSYNERMVESFGSYETACKGKRQFATEADARHAAKLLRKTVGSRVRPYQCNHCGFIHNGHLRRGLVVSQQIRKQQSIEKY
jgi:hypothetical protein